MARRKRRQKQETSNEYQASSGPAVINTAHAGVSAASDRGDKPGDTAVMAAVLACFLLSGFAALLYQTAWLRQFSIVFGTSELAVAIVLAAYMGGLAAGAAVAGRYIQHVQKPVLVYGLLEAGIALSALAVPLLLSGASALYVAILGDLPEPPDAMRIGQPVFYLVVTFVVLAVPTACMGATLPLLTRYAVKADSQVGPRVAMLYATNTLGAVLGTLTAGFVLLPALGLRTTVWTGVSVNVVVFLLAVLLASRTRDITVIPVVRSASATVTGVWHTLVAPFLAGQKPVLLNQPVWILPLMLISGANAFYYEVLWTRLLSHVLGGSVYAFATMLAAFLGGIALGGGLSGTVARNRERSINAFAISQLLIALFSAGVYLWMQALVPDQRSTAEFAMYAMLVMLPATVFIGATFPLAVRILTHDEYESALATARVYAWNTAGAITGAILAGFILIPLFGFAGSIKAAVLANITVACCVIICVAPFRLLPAILTTVILAVTLVWYQPSRPQAVISTGIIPIQDSIDARELYFAVGRSATVRLVGDGSRYYLRSNGLPEATIAARGAPPQPNTVAWLTALPIAARPGAGSLLVVGFGGGVALEGVPASIKAIDTIELEPEIINAGRLLADRRPLDPLADPRLNVIFNDARNAMRLTNKHYDIIVSQPSHPWTAGASHLFTREFAELAHSRLNEGGVFLQWMAAGLVDESLLRGLAATLLDVFDSVRLYQSADSLYFLASDAALDLEYNLDQTGEPLNRYLQYYSKLGLNSVDDFLAALVLDDSGIKQFAAGGTLVTDDKNSMAMESLVLNDGLDRENIADLLAPYDPLLHTGSSIYQVFGNRVDLSYIASRMLAEGRGTRAVALRQVTNNESLQYLISGLIHEYQGRTIEAQAAYLEALRSNPASNDAGYLLLRPQLGAVAMGQLSGDMRLVADQLTGSAAVVIRGWPLVPAQDWQALAALDGELADANISDPWYSEAVRLRAQWRTMTTSEQQNTDALQLLDRALAIQADMELLVLRATAASNLGDSTVLIETGRALGEFIATTVSGGGANLAIPRLQLMELRLNAFIDRFSALARESEGENRRNYFEVMEVLRRALSVVKQQISISNH